MSSKYSYLLITQISEFMFISCSLLWYKSSADAVIDKSIEGKEIYMDLAIDLFLKVLQVVAR